MSLMMQGREYEQLRRKYLALLEMHKLNIDKLQDAISRGREADAQCKDLTPRVRACAFIQQVPW